MKVYTLISRKSINLVHRVMKSRGKLFEQYKTYCNLVEKITNPLSPGYCDVRFAQKGCHCKNNCKFVFLSPSRSLESHLIKSIFNRTDIAENFSVFNTIIDSITNGVFNLLPDSNSGWYDYNLYAVEPLLRIKQMPESTKLKITPSYLHELRSLFKSVVALGRETHIKSLEITEIAGSSDEPTIYIKPDLSIEPLPSYYLRLAQSYKFIKSILTKSLSESILKDLRRLSPEDPSDIPLVDELTSMESLFYGLTLISLNETDR